MAESWEVSAHPNGPTTVLDGPLAGRSLAELMDEYGVALVGRRNREAVARGRFPLLIKFLDAHEWLSVQVHPSDDAGAGLGKTEMWVVLDAEPDAELLLGLDAAVDSDALRQAIADDRLVSLLHRLPVRKDDVFLVPAGTIHALGPGMVLAEIQQSSDTTYRLYDWDREVEPDRPRALHLEEGVAVADLTAIRPGAVEPEVRRRDGRDVEILAACPHFRTERLKLSAGERYAGRCDGESFELWCVLSGAAGLEWTGEPLAFEAVRWLLLPAEIGRFEIRADSETTLLRVVTPTRS